MYAKSRAGRHRGTRAPTDAPSAAARAAASLVPSGSETVILCGAAGRSGVRRHDVRPLPSGDGPRLPAPFPAGPMRVRPVRTPSRTGG